jgi:opacity protein-like surface antigen
MKNLFIASMLALSTSAFAVPYAGIQGGVILEGLNSSNNAYSAVSFKDNSYPLAGRLYAGYGFNKYFSIETGYLLTTNATIHTDILGKDANKFHVKEQIADVVGKGSFYMGDKFYVYGKAGVAYITVKETLNDEKTKNINLVYGAGLGYDVSDSVSVDLSWTRYNGKDTSAEHLINGNWKPSLDFYAVGVTYKF